MKPLHPRSWLFVPASVGKAVASALSSAAEAVILDLEDSVPDASKAQARQCIDTLPPHPDKQIWVRVNSRHTEWHAQDVAASLRNKAIDGLLLPKVESAADCLERERLGSANRAQPMKQGALLESALGVLKLASLLESAVPIDMIMFGGAENGDLMTDLQCAWSSSGMEMLYARQHALLCARAHHPCQAVDGVYVRLDDDAGLADETRLSRSLGYRARAAIHPRQLPAINDIYAPTALELERARRVMDEFETALQRGHAAVRVDGKLVDYAMYRAACRIANKDELRRPA